MTSITFLLLLFTSALAAHLPAIRQAFQHDEKRALASRLIRSANKHKDRSLRDVLRETDAPTPKFTSRRDEQRLKMRVERVAKERFSRSKPQQNSFVDEDGTRERSEEDDVRAGVHTMSQLFAWAINNTVKSVAFSYSTKLPEQPIRDDIHQTRQTENDDNADQTQKRKMELLSQKRALPTGTERTRGGRARRKRMTANLGISRDDFDLLKSATESEFDIIKRNVRILDMDKDGNPKQRVKALLMLEELCHSIDNGRDLQISGGIKPVLNALHSHHENVRASAAWALATCCQNNPPVQNASLALGAVPMLSHLAADDQSSTVRAKALFALNAMLELEDARTTFEELPGAINVLKNALVDSSDFRATRRALNLTELLVQRNLDAWKTQLEAYDVPVVIELLMRSHPDRDVRESAARTIAALDGRHFA